MRGEIDHRLETIPDEWFDVVGKSQLQLFDNIDKLIRQLDVTDGLIVNNERNRNILAGIDNLVNETLFSDGSEYVKGLGSYGREIIQQGALIEGWFADNISNYTKQQSYAEQMRRLSIRAVDKFTQDYLRVQFTQPLVDLVDQSLTAGVSPQQMTASVKQYIEGTPELDGKLLKYAKTIGRDLFSAADRELTVFIADDLGLKWYIYAGGTVKDSRQFCVERAGKYFHRNEIESWVNLSWQGKAPVNEGTIFVLLGGYNCLHVLLPVDISAVPADVIERNKLSGNYEG